MNLLNAEFKARVKDLATAEQRLLALNPRFVGEDRQTDTYFNTNNGRLKFREGNIENALIFYRRSNQAGVRQSDITISKQGLNNDLKFTLVKALGILAVVEKKRRIYFIENVKFHFDAIEGLGSFIEVEAIQPSEGFDIAKLEIQCRQYEDFFNIDQDDLIGYSYCDMLVAAM